MMKRMLTIMAGTLLLGASTVAAQSTSTAPSTSSSSSMEMQGKHSMQGEVTKVDAKKGWVNVKTSEGSMKLHFPPAALQNVKKGDTVTVDLALRDTGPAASARTTRDGAVKDTSKDASPSREAPATRR